MKENKGLNFHIGGNRNKMDKVLRVNQLATEISRDFSLRSDSL